MHLLCYVWVLTSASVFWALQWCGDWPLPRPCPPSSHALSPGLPLSECSSCQQGEAEPQACFCVAKIIPCLHLDFISYCANLRNSVSLSDHFQTWYPGPLTSFFKCQLLSFLTAWFLIGGDAEEPGPTLRSYTVAGSKIMTFRLLDNLGCSISTWKQVISNYGSQAAITLIKWIVFISCNFLLSYVS